MDETSQKIDEKLSEQDRADLASLGLGPDAQDETPEQHSLLRVWSEVLSNIEDAAAEPVSMGVAGKIVAGWPQISFQETERYHELYHDYLLDVRSLLEATIADHPGAIDHMEADDIAENFEIYKALVISWNIRLDELEQAWRATDEDSHVVFAALVDARGFLFSRTGFAGHLEARGFTLDTEEIVEAIQIARGEK